MTGNRALVYLFNSAQDGGWILVFNVAIAAKNVGRVKGMVIYILYRIINYLYYNILYFKYILKINLSTIIKYFKILNNSNIVKHLPQ